MHHGMIAVVSEPLSKLRTWCSRIIIQLQYWCWMVSITESTMRDRLYKQLCQPHQSSTRLSDLVQGELTVPRERRESLRSHLQFRTLLGTCMTFARWVVSKHCPDEGRPTIFYFVVIRKTLSAQMRCSKIITSDGFKKQ